MSTTDESRDARLRLSYSVHGLMGRYSKKSGRSFKWVAETAILEWLQKQPEYAEIAQAPKSEQAA